MYTIYDNISNKTITKRKTEEIVNNFWYYCTRYRYKPKGYKVNYEKYEILKT